MAQQGEAPPPVPNPEAVKPNNEQAKPSSIAERFFSARQRVSETVAKMQKTWQSVVKGTPQVDLFTEAASLKNQQAQLLTLEAKTEQALASGAIKEEQADGQETKNQQTTDKEVSNEDIGRKRAEEALTQLANKERLQNTESLFASNGLVVGGDKIEGQQIDFISQRDGRTAVHFKLSSNMVQSLIQDIIPKIPSELVSDGKFTFRSINGVSDPFSDSWVVKVDDKTILHISKAARTHNMREFDYNKPIYNEQGEVTGYDFQSTQRFEKIHALIGSVQIEVIDTTDVGEIAEKVESAFKLLSIDRPFDPPDDEEERNNKEARFRWQHKIKDDADFEHFQLKYLQNHGEDLIQHLKREEVADGYHTIVDKGVSEIYQRDGRLFIVHDFPFSMETDSLEGVFSHGLMSSSERYKRGLQITGNTTAQDFITGGADSVFLRVLPQGSADGWVFAGRITALIDPKVLDRTDWYAYNQDFYGNTEQEAFENRPTPEVFFKHQRENFNSDNEIMMRRIISPDMITHLVGFTEMTKQELIEDLIAKGITEINGKKLEDFILTAPTLREIANPKSKKK